jgi:serine/threonine protein kinase
MTHTTIGKFEVQSRLSRGGMAEVYRCCLKGIGGFEKVVVVKRIRWERAEDPDFVSMFLDEARLAANLNHPNIVQVFEIDEVDGAPYIAMEYVRGPTLAMLLRQARQANRMHLGHACKILAGVCEGLHYAHTATSPAGEPLGLVHRDVSPQNIIVSRDGVPKLLDFGVAKANGRLTETLAGTLKGKLRYIAPEQLSGMVDHRADVFAVGVCLFEATTGQSPYGPSINDELALLDSIGQGRHNRPSRVVADYPPALEEIVLAAIHPDPERRCQSARELHDRLEQFVAEGPFASSTRAVAGWVGELHPQDEDSSPALRPHPELPETLAETVTPVPAAARPRARRRAAVLVAGAALLAAGGLATALVSHRPPARPVVAAAAPASNCVRQPRAEDRSPPPAPLAVEPAARERPTREGSAGRRRRPGRAAETTGSASIRPPAELAIDDEPSADAERSLIGALPLLGAPVPERPVAPPPVRHEVPAVRPAARPTDAAAASRIFSVKPHPSVAKPALPKLYTAQGPDDLQRILTAVEQETVKAGCSPEFSRGITGAVYRTLVGQRSAEVFPAAMYYFIVTQAALGREKKIAEDELRRAHSSGIVRALNRLP